MLATRLRAAYGVFVRLLTNDFVSEQDWEELEARIGAVRDDLLLSQRRAGVPHEDETTSTSASETEDVVVGGNPGRMHGSPDGEAVQRLRNGPTKLSGGRQPRGGDSR